MMLSSHITTEIKNKSIPFNYFGGKLNPFTQIDNTSGCIAESEETGFCYCGQYEAGKCYSKLTEAERAAHRANNNIENEDLPF